MSKKLAEFLSVSQSDDDVCANFGKIKIISKGFILDSKDLSELDSKQANFALAQEFGTGDKQEDLLYVAFKLVHVGANKNKDGFTEEDLKNSKETPVLKLLNWGHKEPNIGVIYASKFKEATDDEPAHLLVAAAISKYKYRDLTKEMLQRYQNENLFFSMETWYKEAECSVCNAVFAHGEEYCDHLTDRFAAGSGAVRMLHGLVFAGAGVVEVPADELALPISIAKKTDKEKGGHNMADVTYTEDQYNALKTELEKANTKIVAFETDINGLKELINTLEKAAESNSTELLNKDNKISELTASLETAKSEFNEFKTAIEASKKLVDRLNELFVLGFVLPEDQEQADKLSNEIKNMSDEMFSTTKIMFMSRSSNHKQEEIVEDEEIGEENKEDQLPVGSLSKGSSNTISGLEQGLKTLFAVERNRRRI